MWPSWIILIIFGYLMGSIPCAYLLVKLKNGLDIRKFGSGNPGSTNSTRAAGPVIGAMVFLCDCLKSALPTWIALQLEGSGLAVCTALAAFLGHLFPLWLSFQGGKGVACTLSIGFVLVPGIAAICFGIWAVVILISGYVSMGSCIGVAMAFPLCLATMQPWPVSLFFLIAAALVALRHKKNIEQIKKGTERKVLRRK
ncbi:MAG: glycerol-3-phosphate 1-O-acyltransferase PlsY [Bacillota bacterium]|nr:glycerol-3-phosphate 1-O-acyltransferase PlsY [Bacillota bacterium]